MERPQAVVVPSAPHVPPNFFSVNFLLSNHLANHLNKRRINNCTTLTTAAILLLKKHIEPVPLVAKANKSKRNVLLFANNANNGFHNHIARCGCSKGPDLPLRMYHKPCDCICHQLHHGTFAFQVCPRQRDHQNVQSERDNWLAAQRSHHDGVLVQQLSPAYLRRGKRRA